MKRMLCTIMVSVYLCLGTVSFAQDASSLTYMTEEYPPYQFKEAETLKGIAVDLLKLMWAKMGVPEQTIAVYPWVRGYNLFLENPNSVLFSMIRTPEREEKFKWVGPIFTARTVLVGLTQQPVTIRSLEDAKQYKIGTIREDAAEQLLKAAGFDKRQLEAVVSLEQNIKKLQAHRIQLIAHSEKAFNDFVQHAGLDPTAFAVAYVIQSVEGYYAFHKECSDDLVARFQNALNSLEPERQKLLEQYGQ